MVVKTGPQFVQQFIIYEQLSHTLSHCILTTNPLVYVGQLGIIYSLLKNFREKESELTKVTEQTSSSKERTNQIF